MSILNKVTLQCLKKNKVRTIVTIIGIILSTAMFTAVTTSISSFQNYMLRSEIDQEGAWEAVAYDMDREQVEALAADPEVKETFRFRRFGYMEISRLLINGTGYQECKNDSKPYLAMESVDYMDSALVNINLVSGRMPETETEILIPKHLVTNGGVSLVPGDTITGTIGQREKDGLVLGIRDPYAGEDEAGGREEFRETGFEKTYTVVGIYERLNYSAEPYYSPGYTVLCGRADETQEPVWNVFFTVHHVSGLFDFLDGLGNKYDWHGDLLRLNGVARQASFRRVYWGLGTILSAIIMFGSVALIYNAFSISVNERIKQFGLLSSLGATKRQLKRSVLFEACTVSLLGIPFGILAGMAGMGVTFYLLRDRFAGLYNGSTVPLALDVELWAIATAALLAFLTVLVSASIPADKALKVPAIEAIRQNGEIHCTKRVLKTPRFLCWLFGLEGMLADKNFKRNRKKYRSTVISLFVSIVLFISASSFVDYLKTSVSDVVLMENYDIVYHLSRNNLPEGFSAQELVEKIGSLASVDSASLQCDLYLSLVMERGALSGDYLNYAEGMDPMAEEDRYVSGSEKIVSVYFSFLPDKEYSQYVDSYGLKGRGYFSGYKEALVFDNFRIMQDERYLNIHCFAAGEGALRTSEFKMEYYLEETEGGLEGQYQLRPVFGEEMELGYYVVEGPERPTGISRQGVSFAYPYSALKEIFPEYGRGSERFYILAKENGRAYEEIRTLLFSEGLDDGMLFNIAESEAFEQNLVLIINVFSYGFIVLISLIAAANVFNTISTNISLRRREFAMLESIGMTKKGLYRMLNYECILYGTKSILYGLPVSILVTYFIYRVVSDGYEIGFYVPGASILIAVASVFLVVFATMFYAAGKLKKNSVVETLKNENI